ncbi:hypothetical protein [Paenibacillus methanolicus]|uniref:Uncharacterized protein n=1 Tax=Paenibacillus methanolicus TaxID=582686 RepID=A0A5S5CB51_9BACL|nr:hypothetical protein [Paenibacillus methanolicus]TYP75576.1 hypothetical protein BCM02_104256 [Paenibacillus methanolicus]
MEAFDAIEPFEWLDAVDWWGTTADRSSASAPHSASLAATAAQSELDSP